MNFKYRLGEVLKDKVTGFKGVAMARTEYYTGCVHYGLAAQKLVKDAVADWEWIDEKRLVLVKSVKSLVGDFRIVEAISEDDPGGPESNPPSM